MIALRHCLDIFDWASVRVATRDFDYSSRRVGRKRAFFSFKNSYREKMLNVFLKNKRKRVFLPFTKSGWVERFSRCTDGIRFYAIFAPLRRSIQLLNVSTSFRKVVTLRCSIFYRLASHHLMQVTNNRMLLLYRQNELKRILFCYYTYDKMRENLLVVYNS